MAHFFTSIKRRASNGAGAIETNMDLQRDFMESSTHGPFLPETSSFLNGWMFGETPVCHGNDLVRHPTGLLTPFYKKNMVVLGYQG